MKLLLVVFIGVLFISFSSAITCESTFTNYRGVEKCCYSFFNGCMTEYKCVDKPKDVLKVKKYKESYNEDNKLDICDDVIGDYCCVNRMKWKHNLNTRFWEYSSTQFCYKLNSYLQFTSFEEDDLR